MHLSEGVIAGPVLAGGWAITAAMTAMGLRRLDGPQVVRVGLLAAAFYVASLVHVPLGPGNVHLVLNGLLGLLLGWVAAPAILVGLLLQAVMFQFGGLAVLGVNTVVMALPAVICGFVAAPLLAKGGVWRTLAAFGCGAGAIFLSGLLAAAALMLTGPEYRGAAWVILAAHVPIMLLEGLLTAFLVGFLAKAKPELLCWQ